jgi:predicted nuclease of predicted toxin-antitoxin system
MKFLVDNQLPATLARWLAAKDHDAVHVLDCGLDSAHDIVIWERAASEKRIVISKDEDFFHLANRPGDFGCLLWVRMGNCRTPALLARFDASLPHIEQAFSEGSRIVMIA